MVPITHPTPAQRGRRKVTRRAQGQFFEALASGWSVTHAAQRAGVHRQRLYELRVEDDEFAAEWEQAWQAGTDTLVDEVRRRALEGVEEPVYQKGELVGHVRRYSDVLLMFMVKQRDPSFREGAQIHIDQRQQNQQNVLAIENAKPVTGEDIVALMRETGQMQHLPRQRAIAKHIVPYLTPRELEAYMADAVDVEAEELTSTEETWDYSSSS
jgi:hypothetical protein